MERFTRIHVFVAMLGTILFIFDISDATTCNRPYNKLGCFKEGNTNMSLIINDRDMAGIELNWDKFEASIHSLACRCAAKAKQDGYQYFSIRFWAECWAGRSYAELNAILNDETKKSTQCAGYQFQKCNDTHGKECVGKANFEYMYGIAHWGGWQQWAECSKPCGGGQRQRVKVCNKMGITDSSCKAGDSTETKACNTDACPTCKWVDKKYGIGSTHDVVSDTKNKEECLSKCLFKMKHVIAINGVNFFASTPPKCHCEHAAKFSGDNNVATYCQLRFGFPFSGMIKSKLIGEKR